jgi:diaminopimelate epimerase
VTRFVKGHGTENDFVLLPDPDGGLRLDPATVVAICDRRAGLGADGVLRVVRTAADDEARGLPGADGTTWFMDYRNADGSVSEMCGNGIRVFGRYLADHQGADVSAPLAVGSRAGTKVLTFDGAAVSVDMGAAEVLGDTRVSVAGRTWPALHVSMGNPHAVAFVDRLEDAGPLTEAPEHDPVEYPDGVNVEFVVRRGDRHVAMRVHERGSGETRSCGTGACAAAYAALVAVGASEGTVVVDVPGGRLSVEVGAGTTVLTGPAVLAAAGALCPEWLTA